MNKENLLKELKFKAVRSSGAGGQHVNKVSSKVELFFDLENSQVFSDEQRILLFNNLKTRLTKEGLLILTSDESRSQHRNKELVITKFLKLIALCLIPKKKRKPTKPSKASVKRKAESKKRISVKKALRKKPKLD